MIVHNVEQGSPEWHYVRLGLPTTSNFSKICTPTGKKSSQSDDYMHRLIGELACNYKDETHKSWAMERGNTLEPVADEYYQRETNTSTAVVGFITSDNGRIGCSPDRLVGDDGLLEIKCPLQKQHIKNLVDYKLDSQYIPQVQGQMWLTGRQWCDWMSFHPDIRPMVLRIERDDDYINTLSTYVQDFLEQMDQKIHKLKERGVMFKKHMKSIWKPEAV